MRKLFIGLFTILSIQAYSQTFAMSVEGIKLKSACNENNIIVWGGTPAKPNSSFKEIENRLNEFIDLNNIETKYKKKFNIESIVNCEGINGEYDALNAEANELELQVIEFLKTLKNWSIARLNNEEVDYWFMWRFKVKKGYIFIENQ